MRYTIYYQLTLCLIILLTLQTIQEVTGQVAGGDQRKFADSLTNELYTNENECTSSWGVSMVFDLLRPGSSGDTLNQICDIVGLCGPQDSLLWNDTATSLTTANNGECVLSDDGGCYTVAPLIKIANSIWIDINSKLQPGYSEIVGEYLQLTDFTSQDAGGVVNSWVNTSSMGLIESIVDEGPIFPPTRLLAINSIYLNAYWLDRFWEKWTNEDLFYTDVSREEALPNKAHFMHSFGFPPYSDTAIPGYQVVALKYQHSYDYLPDDLSMILVLPLIPGAASVSSKHVVSILPLPDAVNPTEERPFGRGVALAIPKFRIESNYEDELQDSLTELGFTAPFDARRGFCGLLEGEECLFIDRLIQKTFIEVNEEGTTAAAITLAVLAGSAFPEAPVLFLADHPFQFFIYDSKEDLALFEGRVGAPTIPNDWPPAQFQPVHTDPDFWTGHFDGIESPPVQPTPPSTTQSPVQPTPPSTTQSPVQPTPPSTALDDDSDSSALPKGFITAYWVAVAATIVIATV